MIAKKRIDIPSEIAAETLFEHDRTCCMCRDSAKSVQIHHINEDPSDNEKSNLSVLCLECHNETMIKGGFGRKLNADQVIIYRDDWISTVSHKRSSGKN